eukprot:gene3272-biopygen3558
MAVKPVELHEAPRITWRVAESAESVDRTECRGVLRSGAEYRGVPWSGAEYQITRSAVDRRGAPRSAAEYAEYRGVPRSTAECRGTPRSTAEYRGVPRTPARPMEMNGGFPSPGQEDGDCAGGYFCTTADRTPVYTSAGGKRIVAAGSGKRKGGGELGGQGQRWEL